MQVRLEGWDGVWVEDTKTPIIDEDLDFHDGDDPEFEIENIEKLSMYVDDNDDEIIILDVLEGIIAYNFTQDTIVYDLDPDSLLFKNGEFELSEDDGIRAYNALEVVRLFNGDLAIIGRNQPEYVLQYTVVTTDGAWLHYYPEGRYHSKVLGTKDINVKVGKIKRLNLN